jgi:hypothetical protein
MAENKNKGKGKSTEVAEVPSLPVMSLSDMATDERWGVAAWSDKRPAADIRAVGQVASRMDGVLEYVRGIATFNAVRFGHIGKNAEFTKRADLMVALGLSSPGQVTRAEDLGRAAIVHKVVPGTDRWTRVAKAVRASGTAASAVKEALRQDKRVTFATLDGLLDALDKSVSASGESTNSPEQDSGTAGRGGDDPVAEVTAERLSTATPAARLKMAAECIKTLSEVVATMDGDRAGLESVLERLNVLSADVQARLSGEESESGAA